MEDFDDANNAPDTPQRWYHTLIKVLAYNLSFDYPSSKPLRDELRLEKEMALSNMKKQDHEITHDSFVEPCY